MDEITKGQIYEANRTLETPGYVDYLHLQIEFAREKALMDGKKAIRTNRHEKAAYFMAVVAGIDSVRDIFAEVKRLYIEARTTEETHSET